jgi:hypothetical protein
MPSQRDPELLSGPVQVEFAVAIDTTHKSLRGRRTVLCALCRLIPFRLSLAGWLIQATPDLRDSLKSRHIHAQFVGRGRNWLTTQMIQDVLNHEPYSAC